MVLVKQDDDLEGAGEDRVDDERLPAGEGFIWIRRCMRIMYRTRGRVLLLAVFFVWKTLAQTRG